MSCCEAQGDGALGPTYTTAAVISPVQYMHRVDASPIVVAADAWDLPNGAPYTTSNVLSSERNPADGDAIMAALQWVTATDQSAREMQFVGRPMPAGVDFTGGVAWLIGRNGSLTGVVRPWMSLRVFDITGTILRATLIALGEHGNGTNCNANGTRLWAGSVAGGVALAPYVTAEGDRQVLEIGYRMTGLGTANAIYGSVATAGAGNEAAMHVASTAAEGVNPGSRCPYLQLENITWPRAAA